MLAQLDQVVTQLNAGDTGVSRHRMAQPVVDGEGQVALARAEVHHVDLLLLGQ